MKFYIWIQHFCCEACADECEKHQNEHCQRCAQTCHQAVNEYRNIVQVATLS